MRTRMRTIVSKAGDGNKFADTVKIRRRRCRDWGQGEGPSRRARCRRCRRGWERSGGVTPRLPWRQRRDGSNHVLRFDFLTHIIINVAEIQHGGVRTVFVVEIGGHPGKLFCGLQMRCGHGHGSENRDPRRIHCPSMRLTKSLRALGVGGGLRRRHQIQKFLGQQNCMVHFVFCSPGRMLKPVK